MFKTLRNALEIPDVRKKLLFTCFMLVVVRIGCQIPTPGINTAFVKAWWEGQTSTAFNFFNTITGSSFTTMSIFALSISPYITSSIIVQLLTIAIPKLEELQKEGEEGRKKIQQVTRVLTVALALIQSVSMAIGFGSNYLNKYTWYNVLLVAIIMTAGSAVLMWIGERITARGVGNGISMILLFNIISGLPDDLMTMYKTFVKGKNIAFGIVITVVILALLFALVVYVVYLQDGERRISVQYAKKMQGRKMVGGQSSHIPMKVNTAGVIPVIFASSLLSVPAIIASFAGMNITNPTSVGGHIIKGLSQSSWCNPKEPIYTLGLILYLVLLVFFAYFYTSITFNPLEIADNMKKQGGFIPGIRPGKPTSDYLDKVLNYVVFIGAIGLMIVALIPIVLTGLAGVGNSLCFFGTSLIIIVGVVLETLKQIESMMLVRNYKGFLND
ncbi:preprotein translocase subunit SecY [Hominifimenecus microfluidus]|uniref:Protein translocase subunit SecY n=1 Tax=Hominifimenecus microfluidus TaxID=2885348 RepID=A0AAE3E9E9_9FIRM|nr:preprotein translocase subunit SecY [Hominifimenecus microfluidus]MCC2230442.1 preprotein translocase subunit SecY [Hominifimenecus microfluidus]